MSFEHKKAYSLSGSNHKSKGNSIHTPGQSALKTPIQGLIGKQSVKWTFSKANRFSSKNPEPSSEFLTLKTSIGRGRKAGFGYGKRWEPRNPRGKDAPPSTTYNLPSSVDSKKIGGKISPLSSNSNDIRWVTPGPGSYELKTFIGNGFSCSLKSRHSSMNHHYSPSPGAYNPKHSLVEPSRYSDIAFGFKITNDKKGRLNTPGPGTYDLGSTFSLTSPVPSPNRVKHARKSL